ncbi:tyrosine-type recombinase/integrase [Zavarzinella formosa]|uniref:tyrosine-type recombinase/integrase n=1 Tax=Zavarzinella formosa TaxID=360055 RepID=UPI00031D7CB8|nr:site-specific integrase [Zavarzinella formosa]
MRRPEPWYRASKSAWYVQFGTEQVRLAKGPKEETEKEAFDAYYKLMAGRPEGLPAGQDVLTAVLCDLFLDHSQKHHEPKTYQMHLGYLQNFCTAHGRIPAKDIKPLHVNRWLDKNPGWKASRRHAALSVKTAFSWADKQGVLSPSPLRTLTVAPNNPRTRVLTADEQAEILGAIIDREFRQFVRAMLATGCRPGEVARVTAANVNLELGVWVFETHKTSKKTKKPRMVYLTAEMVELSRELMALHPEGPLFRGPRKKTPFTRNGIRCRFRRLREKLPHLKHFVAYSTRHSFATQALVNGVGIAQVAELLGHTSTDMVSSTYGHLAGQVAHMREAAKKATS